MSPLHQRSYAWLALAIAMIACALTYQVWVMTLPLETIVSRATVDDAYLYLEVARNWSLYGFPSFDGQTPTNGIQPLWGGLLALVARAVPETESFVRITGFLCALLNAASAASLLWIGARIHSAVFGSLAAILLSLYFLYTNSIAMMETNLHGLVFCFLLYSSWKLTQGPSSEWSVRELLVQGLLLTLNGFCRLDSGILSAMIWLPIAFVLMRDRRWAHLLAVSLPAVVCLFPYLAYNHLHFGGILPVSGRAKLIWAYEIHPDSLAGNLGQWAASQLHVWGTNFTKASGLPYLRYTPLNLLLASVFAAGFLRLLIAGWLPRPLVALWVMQGIHTTVLCVLLREYAASYWYYQPLRVSFAVTIAWLLATLMERIPSSRVPVACTLLGFMLVTGLSAWKNVQLSPEDRDLGKNVYLARYHAGRWISRTSELDTEAGIGSWNAGQIGYFANPRSVVNLDGLVQSSDFLRDVLKAGTWKEYFRARNIRYLVDYDVAPPRRHNFDHDKPYEEYYRGLIPRVRTTLVAQFGDVLVLDIAGWLADRSD